jgi:sulfur relay (sulfurtransferase) DsrF/TusC family protein
MIAMDVLPQMLFIDDGVYCLIKGQSPEKAGLQSFSERLKTLADLVGLYVAEPSLHNRNLNRADLDENYNLKIISLEEVASLFLENETVITF